MSEAGAVIAMPAVVETRRRSVLRRLLRRPPAVIAGAVVAAFVIIAVGTPDVAAVPTHQSEVPGGCTGRRRSEAYCPGSDEAAAHPPRASPVRVGLRRWRGHPGRDRAGHQHPPGAPVGVRGRLADGRGDAYHPNGDQRRIPFPHRGDRAGRLPGPSGCHQRHDAAPALPPCPSLRLARGTALAITTEEYIESARRSGARRCGSPCVTCSPTSCRPC